MQKIKKFINSPRVLKITVVILFVCLFSVAAAYGDGSTISELQEAAELNESKIAELEDTIDNLNTEISDLEAENENKQSQIDQLTTDAKEVGDLETKITELQEKNNALQAELDSLKASNEASAQEATQAARNESSSAATEISSSDDSSSGGGEVCITQTGSKYHRSSCSTLSRSKSLQYMSAGEAQSAGYEACKVCSP